MVFPSWLRAQAPKSRPAPRCRPQLEALGDRLVPSTLKVTNELDSGKGSLRYEVAHANTNGRDTIVFANNVRTINLYHQINVAAGVTIKGPGAGLLTLTTNYNFGDPWGQSTRVFEVNAAKPVAISGLTITDNGGTDEGGGILNHSALTVSGCTISDNAANSFGGGISNYGTLTLSGCTLTHDSAGLFGGAIYNAGTMTLTGSTLSYDWDGFGHAIYNVGTLSVGTSTFVMSDIAGPYTDLGGNTFAMQQPQIGSFTASASIVTAGGSFTLTASDITDANPGATITQVQFGMFVNGMGGYPNLLATETSPGVWTYTFDTTGWPPGTYTFYATAVDNYGAAGGAATTVTVQVV